MWAKQHVPRQKHRNHICGIRPPPSVSFPLRGQDGRIRKSQLLQYLRAFQRSLRISSMPVFPWLIHWRVLRRVVICHVVVYLRKLRTLCSKKKKRQALHLEQTDCIYEQFFLVISYELLYFVCMQKEYQCYMQQISRNVIIDICHSSLY